MSRPVADTYAASNISATTAALVLTGGRYGIDYVASWLGGSVTLQKLAGDHVTWVTAATAWLANGYAVVDIPGGTYRLLVVSSSSIYVTITRIQGE